MVETEFTDEDRSNPAYIFTLTWAEQLVQIVNGEVNPVLLAKKELANRGLNSEGNWVGFDEAKTHHGINQ